MSYAEDILFDKTGRDADVEVFECFKDDSETWSDVLFQVLRDGKVNQETEDKLNAHFHAYAEKKLQQNKDEALITKAGF